MAPRNTLKAFFVLGLLFGQLGAAFCQPPERSLPVDWSVRLEYLFGTQQIREAGAPNYYNSWPDRLRVDYNPGLWVISGLSEAFVLPRLSARVRASINIPTSDHEVARLTFTPVAGPSLGGIWSARTQFTSWEVAGSYHFLYDGLYRLAVFAGYRRQNWNREGSVGNDVLRDSLSSSIPFIGLQAAMFLPGWVGRFEVFGSPFMNETFTCNATQGSSYSNHSCNASRGGIVEAQMSGSGAITGSLFWGITAKYTFEGMYGPVDGLINGVRQGPYDGYVEQNIGQVGLHLTWIM